MLSLFLLMPSVAPPACAEPACYAITSQSCVEGICDITDALTSAIARCEANPPIPDDRISGARVGCRFELPAGRLLLSKTVTLCRQHEIVGQGGRFWGARTRLETLGGYSGVHVQGAAACKAQGRGWGAAGAVLSGFGLVSTIGTTRKKLSYGVWVEAPRVKLSQLWVRGFVQGIRIEGDVRRKPKTNANLPYLEDVRVDMNEHAGIWVDGGDSNAGMFLAPDASSNCWYWERWKKRLGACQNIHESSFLGNTIVAGHTATCRDHETGAICEGYAMDGRSQRSVCIGCYSEKNQKPNTVSRNSLALGGLSKWKGKGGWLAGHRMNRLTLINDRDPKNVVRLELGDIAPQASPGRYGRSTLDGAPGRWR